MKNKIFNLLSNLKKYWKVPMDNRYMPFKEIAAYSGGGIGAYCIITLGTACILGTGNTLISSTLGVSPTHMYIMYVIAIILNIPLTGIRANIIDNTRNKAGKYRPYIVSMAIPTAIICVLMVWFPYTKMDAFFEGQLLFGESKSYVIKCAIILFLNILLHFFYYFFNDAYENLIHVLSPDSQERADVASVKSIVYSLAPTLVNLFTPIIAQNIFKTNSTDIRVYRLLYPILCVLGILLCIVVYKNTEEKIVQARTHLVQIKFTDALKAVAKNKYFWIISLAGWIGFLEASYSNIMFWLYNYGGACSGNTYGIIITIYGNASLWGMLLAPFLIRKWGKKAVLVTTNIFNIIFILCMLPVTLEINQMTIWLVLACLYMNAFMGSFALILNPSIQADIRDYQQYISGERIDGMFSAVGTIGTVITLATSSVLPMVYEKNGLTKATAIKVTSDPNVLSRVIQDGKTVGEILKDQFANGQDSYTNANSALYDPEILLKLLHVLIIFSAVGALLNVIPYFWYDFNEKKQKSVVKVLKIRAMLEDYSNGALKEKDLNEGIEIIKETRELSTENKIEISKSFYKKATSKAERKTNKLKYKEITERNNNIDIAKFVYNELDKFNTEEYIIKLEEARNIVNDGLNNIVCSDLNVLKEKLASLKNQELSKDTKRIKSELIKSKISAVKAYKKYYSNSPESFIEPDFSILESFFDIEDKCDEQLKELYINLKIEKANKAQIKKQIKEIKIKKEKAIRDSKTEMDRHAYFSRAAKPYIDANRLIKEYNNYSNIDSIMDKYFIKE